MGPLRISLLGGFRVRRGSGIIEEDEWRLKKAASLVKLLALAPQHRLHRERIMDLLWPNLAPKAAANNLRYALHNARQTLESATDASSRYLRLQGEQLTLSSTGRLRVDVEAFEEAASTARRAGAPAAYRAALELYAGDLLPGELYEDWAEGRRTELRTLYLALLVELAGLYEEREEYEPAIEALGRVVADEPAHEEAHVGLMRLHAISGRRGEAIRQYERLREVLRRELAVEPSAESQRLYKDIVAGRPPPARSTSADTSPEEPPSVRLHNLPAARTSFVGRERELVEVKRALFMTALLTLTGAGGSGKTRLALEVARDLVGAYPDGVWFVELAPLSDPGLVAQAVAGALGVREQQDHPLTAILTQALRERKLLLVLDNCEHLIGAVARLVDTLLDSCPGLRILATSREPLGVAGEVSWQVPSLSLPEVQGTLTVEELEGYESARLFVERALYRPSAFVLTAENAPAVAEICRRLDGIPLAIELAAARVGALAVGQISERLSDSLELLTGGGRMATPRQQTLRGALDWSYDLLSEPERLLFCRLPVFASGWTLEAAEVVGADGVIDERDVLDLISRLVDKSLVVAEAGENGALRYRFLEPVRQYARERLEGSGQADAVRQRHALWFLALAEEAEPELTQEQQGLWIERLEVEHDNLRTALRWLLERREIEPTLRLCGALGEFWHMRGYLSEGRRWLEAALETGAGSSVQLIKALAKASRIGWEQGEFERSILLSEESLSLCRETGDKAGAAVALSNLGMAALFREEHGKAEALFEEAVALQRKLGDEAGLARALQALGLTVMSQGDFGHAEALYEEGLALKTGDVLGTELLLLGLALSALGQDEYGRARAYSAQVLDTSLPLSYRHSTAACLHVLAAAAGSEGQVFRAARLWGAAEALREAIGTPDLSPVERTFYARHIAARSRLDEGTWQTAWAEGRMLTPEQAIEYGLPAEEPALPAAFRFAPEASAARSGQGVKPVDRGAASARLKALAFASRMAWEQGGDFEQATVLGEEGLALAREQGDKAGVAAALQNLGGTAMRQNELGRASTLLEEALALQRELGDRAGVVRSLQALGLVEVVRRDHARAHTLHEESLTLAREAGDDFGMMLSLGLGALVALGQGDHERSRELCAKGLDLSQQLGLRQGVVFLLQISAASAGARGHPARSAMLWGAAEALGEEIGVSLVPVERYHYGPYIEAAREQLGGTMWEVMWAKGRMLTPEEAVRHALSAEESNLQIASRFAPEVSAAPAGSSGATRSGSTTELAGGEATPARLKALARVGRIAWEQGDYVSAMTRHEESLRFHRQANNKPGIALSLSNLGLVALYQGDRTSAVALHEESLALRRELRDTRGIAASLHNLGLVALYEAQYVRAKTLFGESLPLFRELEDR
ncbi:MAG: tetratricopeptide repeat protein [Rubrobacteraceae bacterium]